MENKYINLNKLNKKIVLYNTIKKNGYGLRQPIKTVWIGLILDLIIPCTFGLITLGLKKYKGDTLGYVSINSKEW